jgi:HSP20 family protein
VRCEVPGVPREHLTVEIDDGRLSIAGRKPRAPGAAGAARRQERRFGSFRRDLELPYGTDPARAQAALDRGVLTVRVPLRPDARPHAVPVR